MVDDHDKACEKNQFWYYDKELGKKIHTAYFLKKRGYCCNSNCKRCPYDKSNGWTVRQ